MYIYIPRKRKDLAFFLWPISLLSTFKFDAFDSLSSTTYITSFITLSQTERVKLILTEIQRN